MQRTKRMVAAVVAAMALVAIVGAPSAFAGYYSVSAGTTAYTAASTEQQFTQSGGIVGSCSSGGNFVGAVANLDKTIGAVPSDMNCTSSAEGAVSWKWNGCTVTLAPGNDGSPLNGTFSIGGCASVQVNSATCEKRIAPQSGSATFANEGGSVKATASANLSYTVVKAGGSCQNGSLAYSGAWSVSPASGSLSALTSKVGLFHEGGQFYAETPAYPVTASGGQLPTEQYAMTLANSRVLKCEGVQLSGQLSGPSSSLDLAPQYSGCVAQVGATKLPATVDGSACAFRVGGPSAVTCQSESDGIVITLFQNATKQAENVPLCVYRVSPQSFIGIFFNNVGEGVEAGVRVQFGVAKLAYTRVTGTAGNCGEAKLTGAYTGTSVLYGVMD